MNYFPNKKLPYQQQGRWFEVFIESDGTDAKFTQGDIGSAESINSDDNTFVLTAGAHVIDVKADISIEPATGSNVWYQHRLRLYADGSIGIELPNVAHFDAMTLFIFAYFD